MKKFLVIWGGSKQGRAKEEERDSKMFRKTLEELAGKVSFLERKFQAYRQQSGHTVSPEPVLEISPIQEDSIFPAIKCKTKIQLILLDTVTIPSPESWRV